MKELKPCPFCGGERATWIDKNRDIYTVEIIKNGAKTPAMIYDVEAYNCTERVFYARQASGTIHYLPLDGIMAIRVIPDKGGEQE